MVLIVAAAAIGPLSTDRVAHRAGATRITGPFARLLAQSTDLGPAQPSGSRHRRTDPAGDAGQPHQWAAGHGLSVHWRDGDGWAILEDARTPSPAPSASPSTTIGPGTATSSMPHLNSPASPSPPVRVAGLGRILSYTPTGRVCPPTPPRDVPDGGLLPTQLVSAYNMTGLSRQGYTGKGSTVVVFSFDGFAQADMDSFADWFDVPRFTPEVIGGMPTQISGEATMDLQMIHAVAPDAKLVMVNARSTVENGSAYIKLGELMESVDRQFPGRCGVSRSAGLRPTAGRRRPCTGPGRCRRRTGTAPRRSMRAVTWPDWSAAAASGGRTQPR